MKATIEIPDGYTLVKVSDTEYKVVKEEKKLPETWEEFCETHPLKGDEYSFDEYQKARELIWMGGCKRSPSWKLLFPNKEKAEAIIALCQLIQLRDCYNDGWVPDWRNSMERKHIIKDVGGEYSKIHTIHASCIFAFKSEELRDKFLENFRDLLDKIKPLYQ